MRNTHTVETERVVIRTQETANGGHIGFAASVIYRHPASSLADAKSLGESQHYAGATCVRIRRTRGRTLYLTTDKPAPKAPPACPFCGRPTCIRAGLATCDTCGGLERITVASLPAPAPAGRRFPVRYPEMD